MRFFAGKPPYLGEGLRGRVREGRLERPVGNGRAVALGRPVGAGTGGARRAGVRGEAGGAWAGPVRRRYRGIGRSRRTLG
ncbi:hypothetical protein Shyhy02_66230 [Streptomyces hygroscopicus subsp. hygroscopicus]|nr:hypothetical protein Shyhy02_66230 [Streptomyces hygroscopicus subsp. hygroscopicus]